MAGEIYVGLARRSPKKNWRYQDLYRKAKPSYAKASEGEIYVGLARRSPTELQQKYILYKKAKPAVAKKSFNAELK
jgi:hypothetical protein